MKRLISLALTAIMLLSSASILGVAEADYTLSPEPLTLKLAIVTVSGDMTNEYYVFEKLAELTNISFEIESINIAQAADRIPLIFASKDLPDVIINFTMSASDQYTYALAGQLMPITDLLPVYAPDYWAYFTQFADEAASKYAPDGELYGMAGYFANKHNTFARGFIDRSILDALNLKTPETYEEFYKVLTAVKSAYPDIYPLSGSSLTYSPDMFVGGAAGFAFSYGDLLPWQVYDGQYTYFAQHPNYLTYLKWMNQLYAEGLLDPECYTQNDEMYVSKLNEGKVFCYTGGSVATFDAEGKARTQDFDFFYGLTSDVNDQQILPGTSMSNLCIFLTSANKHPEETLRYFNMLFTLAGEHISMGPDLGTWDRDPENGIVYSEDGTRWKYEGKDTESYLWWYDKINLFSCAVEGSHYLSDFWYLAQDPSPMENENVSKFINAKATDYPPTMQLTADELNEVLLYEDDLNSYARQMEVRIVTGEEGDDIEQAYQKMVDGMNQRGLAEIVKVYGDAYARYLANIAALTK